MTREEIAAKGQHFARRIRQATGAAREAGVFALLDGMVSRGPDACRVAEDALVRLGLAAWPTLQKAKREGGEVGLAAEMVMEQAT